MTVRPAWMDKLIASTTHGDIGNICRRALTFGLKKSVLSRHSRFSYIDLNTRHRRAVAWHEYYVLTRQAAN